MHGEQNLTANYTKNSQNPGKLFWSFYLHVDFLLYAKYNFPGVVLLGSRAVGILSEKAGDDSKELDKRREFAVRYVSSPFVGSVNSALHHSEVETQLASLTTTNHAAKTPHTQTSLPPLPKPRCKPHFAPVSALPARKRATTQMGSAPPRR